MACPFTAFVLLGVFWFQTMSRKISLRQEILPPRKTSWKTFLDEQQIKEKIIYYMYWVL